VAPASQRGAQSAEVEHNWRQWSAVVATAALATPAPATAKVLIFSPIRVSFWRRGIIDQVDSDRQVAAVVVPFNSSCRPLRLDVVSGVGVRLGVLVLLPRLVWRPRLSGRAGRDGARIAPPASLLGRTRRLENKLAAAGRVRYSALVLRPRVSPTDRSLLEATRRRPIKGAPLGPPGRPDAKHMCARPAPHSRRARNLIVHLDRAEPLPPDSPRQTVASGRNLNSL
jgi:hypothetical protein